MHRHTAVASIIAATWALSACGVNAPDADGIRATSNAARLLVDLQSLPDGHPPLPGFSEPPTLPEGHPPIPGFHSPPALPVASVLAPALPIVTWLQAGKTHAIRAIPNRYFFIQPSRDELLFLLVIFAQDVRLSGHRTRSRAIRRHSPG